MFPCSNNRYVHLFWWLEDDGRKHQQLWVEVIVVSGPGFCTSEIFVVESRHVPRVSYVHIGKMVIMLNEGRAARGG